MGRWSQRRLAGGGPPATASSHNLMVSATATDADRCEVSYATFLDAALLDPADFSSAPGGAIGTVVTQLADTIIAIEWSLPTILTDTDITYSGSASGLETPQTIALT